VAVRDVASTDNQLGSISWAAEVGFSDCAAPAPGEQAASPQTNIAFDQIFGMQSL